MYSKYKLYKHKEGSIKLSINIYIINSISCDVQRSRVTALLKFKFI